MDITPEQRKQVLATNIGLILLDLWELQLQVQVLRSRDAKPSLVPDPAHEQLDEHEREHEETPA